MKNQPVTEFHPAIANFGTSFPTNNLYVGYRFFRTDRGLLYYYDGTRWLTAEVFNVQMLSRSIMPFAQAAVISLDANIAAIAEYSGTLIEKVNWSIYQSTTATASVNISLAFYAFTSTGAGTSNLFTTSPTNNGAVSNTWTSFSNVPTLLVPTALNNTYTKVEVALTSNGATGNWYAAISVKCRGIG